MLRSSYLQLITLLLITVQLYAQNKVSLCEYWIDNNFVNKTMVPVSPNMNAQVLSGVNVQSLRDGIHTLYLRCADDSGRFSGVVSSFFYKHTNTFQHSVTLAKYEYWIDSGFQNRVSGTYLGNQVNFTLSIPSHQLNFGIHQLYIRFQDADGKWSSAISSFFYKTKYENNPFKQLVEAEFWYNQDYVNKTIQPLTSNAEIVFISSPNLAQFNQGIHQYNVRFKDATGTWSPVVTGFFYKKSPVVSINQQINLLEFWVDNFARSQVSISQQSDITYINNISMSSLTEGIHQFYFRTKDISGNWSSLASSFFYKSPINSVSNNTITKVEYWINDDFAGRQQEVMPTQKDIVWLSGMNVSTLPDGVHQLFIRTADKNGLWSIPIQSHFIKYSNNFLSNNKISAFRYWIDDDIQHATHVAFQTPLKDISILTSIDMHHSWKGSHFIHIQTIDEYGQWSVVYSDTVLKNSLPIADFSATDYTLCVNDSVTFISTQVDGDTTHWDFGNGTTSSDSIVSMSYATPGIYSVSLWVKDTITGIDSSLTKIIRVSAFPLKTITTTPNDTLCEGEFATMTLNAMNAVYLWNTGDTTASIQTTLEGYYAARIINAENNSCAVQTDSLFIKINPLPIVNIGNDSVYCANIKYQLDAGNIGSQYLWSNGATARKVQPIASGQYSVIVTNQFGCKGYDTAVCTINPIPLVNLGNDTSICEGKSIKLSATNPGCNYFWSTGSTDSIILVNASGRYDVIVNSSSGCTNFDTIQVSINPLPVADFSFLVSKRQVNFTSSVTNGITYLWDFGDGNTSNDINPIHEYLVDGTYTVKLTVTNNCGNRILSKNVTVSNTGISNYQDLQWNLTVFPNPAKEIVFIDIDMPQSAWIEVRVYDITGKYVATIIEEYRNSGIQHTFLGTEQFANGMYFVDVLTDNGRRQTKKFMIQK